MGLREPSQLDHGALARNATPPLGLGGALFALGTVVAVLGGILWSVLGAPPLASRRLSVFGGSLVLSDVRPLSVIDVTTATVEVRLEGVDTLVGASDYATVQPVAVQGGTVLVNKLTGSFNFLGADNYVTDPHAPGVGLGSLSKATGAAGIAAGADAYIIRSAPTSTVSLVGSQTVSAALAAQSKLASPRARVSPIGFATLPGRAVLSSSARAVQGVQLWQLAESGGGCQLYQLVPDRSAPEGISVHIRATFPRQTCRGLSVESAANFVAVASPGWVTVLDPAPQPSVDVPAAGHSGVGTLSNASFELKVASPTSGRTSRSVRTSFTDATTSTVAVTGAVNEAWFLARGGSGWSLYGVSRSGTLVGPKPLSGFHATSDPAPPVLSAGYLYTIDRTQIGRPALWQIRTSDALMSPVAGTNDYPLYSSAEAKNTFTDAEVLGDGPRVVFNNPQNLEAVVVFTDKSRPPAVVDKADSVTVSAQGPAVLTATPSPGGPVTKSTAGKQPGSPKQNGNPGAPDTTSATTVPAPSKTALPLPVVSPLSRKVVCATTSQQPHVPQITAVTPSSEDVLVAWSYQLLQETDCEPQSWTVQVEALGGAPQPAPSIQRVTGEQEYLFSGLRPATSYVVSVTAYINSLSTTSNSLEFTTLDRGPDAPLSVSAVADSNGDWVVSWVPCTEAANPHCVVPADSWSVLGSACGGTVVTSPPQVVVSGDKDTVVIPSEKLGLLGDAFSFSVQGELSSGLVGRSTADGTCTRSWADPTASDISLTSAGAAHGSSLSAQLQVDVTGDPTAAFGTAPSQADFIYKVGNDTVGPTNETSVTVPGLSLGTPYVATVTVYPSGHPNASVTVSGSAFQINLPWPSDLQPDLEVQAAVESNPNKGIVTVGFPADLPAVPLTAVAGVLSCSDVSLDEPPTPIIADRVQFPVDLVDLGGACKISFNLADTSGTNPYGIDSPLLTASFEIGSQPSYSFAVTAAETCQDPGTCGQLPGSAWQVVVSSNGPQPLAGGAWTVSTATQGAPPALPAPSGTTGKGGQTSPGFNDPCAASKMLGAPSFPVTIELPQTCPNGNDVTVTVSYRYLGQEVQVEAGTPATPPPSGPTSTPTSTGSGSTTTTSTGSGSTTTTSTGSGSTTTSTGSGSTTTTTTGSGSTTTTTSTGSGSTTTTGSMPTTTSTTQPPLAPARHSSAQ